MTIASKQPWAREKPGITPPLTETVHIFALFALAVSHPIYMVLGRADHAPFFFAHQARGLDIYLLVLIFSIVLPAVVCILLWCIRFLSADVARWCRTTLIAILLLLIALPLTNTWFGASALNSFLAAALLALAGSWLYLRSTLARSFVTVLALGVVVSPAMFISSESVRSLLQSPKAEQFPVSDHSRDLPDIVLILFDELPLISLLDARGEIDPVRYPNFARLARTSTWYKNALTNHYSSWDALAGLLVGDHFGPYRSKILQGKKPETALLDRSNAPQNLFTLLEPYYQISAIENTSNLSIQSDSARSFAPPLANRLLLGTVDATVVYSHIVTPPGWRHRLPAIEGQWSGYTDLGRFSESDPNWEYSGRAKIFKQTIDQLTPTEIPALYYLHILLPHFPFTYDERGNELENKFKFLSADLRKATGFNNWPDETVANVTWQAHLLQLVFTDLLLGKLLDRLNELGMFEDTLIIIAADHGTSFYWDTEGLSTEQLATIQASETLGVPLFVKLPGQDEGRISNKPAQLIDIVPTLADYLDLSTSWETGGLSLLDEIPADRVRIARTPAKRALALTIDPEQRGLHRKLGLFGDGDPNGIYAFGPDLDVIGRDVADFPSGGTVGFVTFDRPEQYLEISPNGIAPTFVEGELINLQGDLTLSTVRLAVAVNGVVRGTASLSKFRISELGPKAWGKDVESEHPDHAPVHFLARLPRGSFGTGRNEITVHAVVIDPATGAVSFLDFDRA
jgi:hypothetical protein